MAKKEIVDVNGLLIKTESVYKVTGKKDTSAPSGFQTLGVTKLPSDGISHNFECRYVITDPATGTGVYDTGLYEESPCYANASKTEVKERIKKLKEFIVDPYERRYGKGTLSHSNTEFWSTTGVRSIAEGDLLSTEDIDQLLTLYIAMQSYELTPRDKVGNPKYNQSQYCIEDREQVRSIKDERNEAAMNAINDFMGLLKENKGLLINMLKYAKINGITEETNDKTLQSVFYEWINKSTDNVEEFSRLVEVANNPKKKDVFAIYALLQRAVAKKVVTYAGGVINYKGTVLGGDMKTAAHNLNSNDDFNSIKIELLDI